MRLRVIQPIERMYEARPLPVPSARMAFNAVGEPILINDRSRQTMNDIAMALIGMLQRGGTYSHC